MLWTGWASQWRVGMLSASDEVKVVDVVEDAARWHGTVDTKTVGAADVVEDAVAVTLIYLSWTVPSVAAPTSSSDYPPCQSVALLLWSCPLDPCAPRAPSLSNSNDLQ